MKTILEFADAKQSDSLASKLRKKRFALFKSLISSLPRPLSILDVGGKQKFWEMMEFTSEADAKIVIYNLEKMDVSYPNFTSMVGDAKSMKEFKDEEFDVIFSNSVIEHVGNYEQQRQMAKEVQRIGKRYFVQTPNRYFPIEPHFLFPFFQFLPFPVKVFLVRHFPMGWRGKFPDKQEAVERVHSIRLLTERELKALFPGATIYKEKFLGLNKSFIIWGGRELRTS
jgi:hypothetical protein